MTDLRLSHAVRYQIKEKLALEYTVPNIAKMFSCSPSTVYRIKNGHNLQVTGPKKQHNNKVKFDVFLY